MFGLTAGQLRHQVDIQQRGTGVDSFGQQTATWTSVGLTWAKVEPLSGREQLAAGMVRAEVSHKITMRSRSIFNDPKVAAKYRIVYAGRYFNISASLNLEERGRWTVLECLEGLNNG